MSPFNLVYNRQPKLAVDAQLIQPAQVSNVPHFVETFLPSLEVLHKIIVEKTAENREVTQKHQFARSRPPDIKENDLVYKFDMAHALSGPGHKLKPRYQGPFRVLEMIGSNNVRLKNLATGKIDPTPVHIDT